MLRKLALQRGPVHITLLIPEDRGALMSRRSSVMAASRVKVGLGRPLDTRSLPSRVAPPAERALLVQATETVTAQWHRQGTAGRT